MVSGNNLADRLIGQLDALVAFLSLAHEEVFDVVSSEYDSWVPKDQQDTLPGNFGIYRTQISHAALLLGLSYFEAFLSDVVRLVLRSRPEILPTDKKITFGQLLDIDSEHDVLGLLIEREVLDVMFGSFESIASYFKNRLNLEWPVSSGLREANLIRNCIIHNMARADTRLVAAASVWTVGQEIALIPSDVHNIGIDVRRFAQDVWSQVERQLPITSD
ncbi:MAG: hypothetical protein HZB44_08550 [Actinobacteria bacterium]|nr:hypothetical protein [Actinomycetota bacterium]